MKLRPEDIKTKTFVSTEHAAALLNMGRRTFERRYLWDQDGERLGNHPRLRVLKFTGSHRGFVHMFLRRDVEALKA